MTGFRVVRGRAGTASSGVDGRPVTFGKVMGGGLPAAAFGGRADVMAPPRPGRPGLPGRHAVREPGRGRRRAWPRCGCADDASTPRLDAAPRTGSAGWSATRWPRRACRTACQRAGQHVLGLLHRRRRCTTTTARAGRRTLARSRRSSTRCSTAGSTCRRRRSRRGSSRPRSTTTRRSSASPTPLPAAAARRRGRRAAERGRRERQRDDREPDRPSHLLRHGEVHNPDRSSTAGCPASGCPSSGAQMAERRRRRRSPTATSPTVVSPRRWSGRRRPPRRSPRRSACDVAIDERLIEAGNVFEGKRVGVGDGALRDPRHWWRAAQPVPAVVGRAVRRRSRSGCSARVHARPRRGRAGTRRCACQPPAADLDAAPLRRAAGGCGTTRASASARWRR